MEKCKTRGYSVYSDFLTTMKETIKENLSEEYCVDIHHVTKNNSVELDSLIIVKEHDRVVPNIYLNPYYERYQQGEKIGNIAEEIIHAYSTAVHEENSEILYFSNNFSDLQSSIIYRLINFEKNANLLKDIPYIPFLDLAVTFHCVVKSSEEGIGTIRITNEHMLNWDTNLEKLKELARNNTPKLFPAVMKSMNDVILEMLRKDLQEKCAIDRIWPDADEDTLTKSAEELYCFMSEHTQNQKSQEMYVLSNIMGINGSSCILYPNVIKELANKLKSDLYILPSSIHELIFVKATDQFDKNSLRNMVLDVNRSQVPEEEILSDSVYYYSRKQDAVSVCCK